MKGKSIINEAYWHIALNMHDYGGSQHRVPIWDIACKRMLQWWRN